MAIIDSVGGYEPKTNNPFFYTDTALVCLTDYNTEVKWFYRTRSQANKQDITTPSTDVNGISTYSAVISQPGFYICEGMSYGSAYSYTAGVFNSTDTIGIIPSNHQPICTIDTGADLENSGGGVWPIPKRQNVDENKKISSF